LYKLYGIIYQYYTKCNKKKNADKVKYHLQWSHGNSYIIYASDLFFGTCPNTVNRFGTAFASRSTRTRARTMDGNILSDLRTFHNLCLLSSILSFIMWMPYCWHWKKKYKKNSNQLQNAAKRKNIFQVRNTDSSSSGLFNNVSAPFGQESRL
jgi:hypothetical protein